MRSFCKNFSRLSFSLGCVLSSYPMFPEWSLFVFVVCQIPCRVLDVQGLLGFSKPLCEVGASVLPLSSCWIKELGLGLSTGPLALVLCGHRVLGHLPLTACRLVSAARGSVLISWPLGPGKVHRGTLPLKHARKKQMLYLQRQGGLHAFLHIPATGGVMGVREQVFPEWMIWA